MGWPPYMTATEIFDKSMYLVKRSYSFLIWNASSLVWHITSVQVDFGSSSS